MGFITRGSSYPLPPFLLYDALSLMMLKAKESGLAVPSG